MRRSAGEAPEVADQAEVGIQPDPKMELDDEYELPFDCLESAEREYNELRDRGQDDEQVTFNYAWMLLKSGRRDPINLIRGADLLHELSKTTESEEKRVLYGYYLAVARYRQGTPRRSPPGQCATGASSPQPSRSAAQNR